MSERIMKKHAFSKFTNDPSNPVVIDMDEDEPEAKQPVIQPAQSIRQPVIQPAQSIRQPVIQRTQSARQSNRSNSTSKFKKDKHTNSSVKESHPTNVQKKPTQTDKQPKHPVTNTKSTVDEKKNQKIKSPNPVYSSDSDFQEHIIVRKEIKRKNKTKQPEVVKPKKRKNQVQSSKHKAKKIKVDKTKTKTTKAREDNHVEVPIEELRSINIRTSPKTLFLAMHSLSEEQKQYVSSIGLGHLLNIKVDGSPSKIGHYAVRNFDHERMVLTFGNGEIQVTKELIHELLGLPFGTVDIGSMPVTPDSDKTSQQWKAQFDNQKDIRPKAVQRLMKQSSQVDLMFKANLFVLLCNTLGRTKSMGTCDDSMVPKITKDLDLSNIDWCSYVYDCLISTRAVWNPNSDIAYYFGPIIFLVLLYLECIRCDAVKVTRGRPAICYWNVEDMREREKVEPRTVGFGMGEMQDPVLPNIEADQKHNSDKQTHEEHVLHKKGKNEDSNLKDGTAEEHISGNEDCHGNVADSYSKDETVEEYISKTEDFYNNLVACMIVFDERLKAGSDKFPDSRFFAELKEKFNAFLKETFTESTNSNQSNQPPIYELASQWWNDNEDELNRSERLAITCTKSDKHTKPKSFNNSPVTSSKISMSRAFADYMYGSGQKKFSKSPEGKIHCPIPLTSVPTIEGPYDQQLRKKRNVSKPACERSPYVVRAIDLSKIISKEDKLISDWVFSAQDDPTDEVFRSLCGVSAQRFHMESFFPKCELFSHVIDVWSLLLNLKEDERSDLSSRRVFCPTDLTGGCVEGARVNDETRRTRFTENLVRCLEDFDESLACVHLIFLPAVRDFHIFLFVIDLKKPDFIIIDNSRAEEGNEARYGLLPEFVHSYITAYLRSVFHPNAEKFAVLPKKYRLEMPWRTIDNHVDCGIFTMRHMETYMGGRKMKGFKADLKKESDAQDQQLAKLRFKYVRQILMSDFNMKKELIRSEAANFHLLSQDERDKMLTEAANRIEDRLSAFS